MIGCVVGYIIPQDLQIFSNDAVKAATLALSPLLACQQVYSTLAQKMLREYNDVNQGRINFPKSLEFTSKF